MKNKSMTQLEALKKQLKKSFSPGTAHATSSSGRTLLTLIHVGDGRLYLLKQQDSGWSMTLIPWSVGNRSDSTAGALK
jgi:serine/threonine protein phosphatase PrpC